MLGWTDCLPYKVNINENGEESSADTHVPELDDLITMSEVREAIRKLKAGKASGICEICGEFLKERNIL